MIGGTSEIADPVSRVLQQHAPRSLTTYCCGTEPTPGDMGRGVNWGDDTEEDSDEDTAEDIAEDVEPVVAERGKTVVLSHKSIRTEMLKAG